MPKYNFRYMSVVAFLLLVFLFGCDREKTNNAKEKLADPGPNVIFPRGKADPQFLDGEPLRSLPETAPSWAREGEMQAASYYMKQDLEIVMSYIGKQELALLLSRPTGGNMAAYSLALWKQKGDDFIEVWRLDQDENARKAIWSNHQNVDGILGDSVIWTFEDKTLLEAFTYHNYPYPNSPESGKSHSGVWADEETVFKRKGDRYIPFGSGVTYYKQGHYPMWPVEKGRAEGGRDGYVSLPPRR